MGIDPAIELFTDETKKDFPGTFLATGLTGYFSKKTGIPEEKLTEFPSETK